jgi:hypothetical protein
LHRRNHGQYFHLPLAVPAGAVAGELVRADVLVAVAIAAGQPWGENRARATRRWIRERTGLDDRTIRASINGTSRRPGLSELVREDCRGAFVFADLRRFVRVTWTDLAALRSRPPFDAVRLMCWTWTRVAGVKPWRRIIWSATEAAEALGWGAGRAWRAMEGAADRAGAATAGLVDLVDGWIWSRAPRRGAVDPGDRHRGKACGSTVGHPVDSRSVRSAPRGIPRTRAEDLYILTPEGSKNLLVDLAARFAVDRASLDGRGESSGAVSPPIRRPSPGGVPPDDARRAVTQLYRDEGPGAVLAAFDRHVDGLRRYRDRGRGWALSVLRRVFEAVGRGLRPRPRKGGRAAAAGGAGPRAGRPPGGCNAKRARGG